MPDLILPDEADRCPDCDAVLHGQMTRAEEHAKKAGIDFDEACHRYTLPGEAGGLVVPSVTEVLKDNGLVDYAFCSAFGRERGSAVHEALHYHVEGELDPDSVDQQVVQPYLVAAEAFMVALQVEPIMAEAVVYSRLWSDLAPQDRPL